MTGVYTAYFDSFINTLNNFLPNVENKSVIIVSDALEKYNNKYINGFHINISPISNFPYPTINKHKYQILNDAIEVYEYDYIAYFDADTIFLKRSNEFWNKMKNLIESNKIINTLHIYYNENELAEYDGKIDKRFNININPKYFYGDATICDFDFINSHNNWIIASMFIMPTSDLKDVSEKICLLNRKNEREWLRTLKFPEETMYNLIYYFDYLNDNIDRYVLERYIMNDIDYVPDESSEYFIIQKYDNDSIKKETKYNFGRKTIYIYQTKKIDSYQRQLYYRLLSKNVYDSNIIFLYDENRDSEVAQSINEYLPYYSYTSFWSINFTEENLFYKKSFYDNYIMIPDFQNIIVLNGINEENVNIDYSKLCDDPNIQFMSDKSFEENKHFKNLNWMYFTKEFIQQNWIND